MEVQRKFDRLQKYKEMMVYDSYTFDHFRYISLTDIIEIVKEYMYSREIKYIGHDYEFTELYNNDLSMSDLRDYEYLIQSILDDSEIYVTEIDISEIDAKLRNIIL